MGKDDKKLRKDGRTRSGRIGKRNGTRDVLKKELTKFGDCLDLVRRVSVTSNVKAWMTKTVPSLCLTLQLICKICSYWK